MGCWELNPGLLQQQKILLTAEPSIQLQRMILKINDAFQFDIHVGKNLTSILDEDQFQMDCRHEWARLNSR